MAKNIVAAFYLVVLILITTSCANENGTKQNSLNTDKVISEHLKWSDRMAQSVMKRHPEAGKYQDARRSRWDYKVGLLMTSFEKLYQTTGKEIYFDYMLDYAQTMVDSTGQIADYDLEEYNIDLINPGKFLFFIYENTGDDRYLTALHTIRSQLDGHPRTNSGGFWHKKIYPYQMWLDGLYMGTPFYARYNVTFENGNKIDDIVNQYVQIQTHNMDEETGLLYHAWDESKQMDWADKETGKSPGFWGRSLGWYAMALVDVLDYIPEDNPKRDLLISYLNDLAEALVKVQDAETGLWWQVPDRAGEEGNYLEASSSSMFAYTFAKAVKNGYLPQEYRTTAEKCFQGLIDELVVVDPDGEVHLTKVCCSAGLGGNPYRDATYNYYVNERVETDDMHGMGPFILAALALDK
jgi:unsaturated rhamnogalacturonyl hydrolase